MPNDVNSGMLLRQFRVAHGAHVANVDLVRFGLKKRKFKIAPPVKAGARATGGINANFNLESL